MCKLALICFVFVSVACGNPARSLDESSSEEGDDEFLKGVPKKYNPFINDLTPEAMYQLCQHKKWKWGEILKKASNKKEYQMLRYHQMLLAMGVMVGFLPALYQLTGDCFPPAYLDRTDLDRLAFEVTFQVKEYCYGKYSDKYIPITRVVDDQFKQVNEYVANAMKGAEMLKQFCEELIINGPSISISFNTLSIKNMKNSAAKKFMKDCDEKILKSGRGH